MARRPRRGRRSSRKSRPSSNARATASRPRSERSAKRSFVGGTGAPGSGPTPSSCCRARSRSDSCGPLDNPEVIVMGTSDAESRNAKDAAKTDGDVDVEPLALDVAALVEAHPVGTLATALGLGYALGGGLFTGFTVRLFRWGLKLGVRLALLPALEREISGLASTVGRTIDGGVDGASNTKNPHVTPNHHRRGES